MRGAYEQAWPRPRVIVTSFPHNPTTACVDLEFMAQLVEFAREARHHRRPRLRLRRSRLRRLRTAVDPPGPRREGRRGRALHDDEVVLDGRLADGLPRRQRRDRRRARQAQVVPRLRIVPTHPDRGDRRDERGPRLPQGAERDLPRPPRHADRRARPHRLAHREAQGDDVRLGADPRAVRGDDEHRVHDDVRPGGQGRALAGQRLRSRGRGLRALRARREREADPAGDRQIRKASPSSASARRRSRASRRASC